MTFMRACFAAAVLAVAVPSAWAANLVDGEWLAKRLGSPGVLVLDAQPRPMHAKGHIAGAVPVDVMVVMGFGLRETPLPVIERAYQALGIDAAKTIVIYDQGATWFAPRLLFQLAYHGFPEDRIVILDGGMAKWQADGRPVSTEATPAPAAGAFKVSAVREQERSRLPELVAASGDRGHNVLVDALGPEYHYGATAFFSKAGHIPNAVLLPMEDFFNADKTFKSAGEIKAMAAHQGVRPELAVHSHCGGGGAAAVPYFALKHLAGYPNVKLSVESQAGWLQDERDLPFWTYSAPSMMRDVDWLATWGGRGMRMYGMSHVSVIDVRAPEAYAQGHVPFAVNVPAEVFRAHAKDPRKLAGLLGAAGVDPSHEAVIVSGGGLTKDAALAYAALDALGQRKISVFMEPLDSVDVLDRMARKGFAITRDATVVGKPAKPGDMAVRAAAYEPGAKPAAAPGPNVVASVDYKQLLAADGTPKPAREIWAELDKAKVPRYANVVSPSGDPGEAAASYYLLKLMGYTPLIP